MGKGEVKAPAPTPEEKSLQAQQTALLQAQANILQKGQKEQELLAPVLYKQLGITPKYDASGTIIGYDETPDESQTLAKQAQTELYKRALAAAKGELPTDPGLVQNLDKQEAVLRESLTRSLGPDYLASTGGSKAIGDFLEKKNNIIEAARRGDLTTAEGLALSASQTGSNIVGNTVGNVLGLSSGQAMNFAQAYGGNAAGYTNPLSILQQNRNMTLQAKLASAQNDPTAALLGGVGQLAGTLGSAAIFMSSEELKDVEEEVDTRDVVLKMRDLPIKRWRYKGETTRHIGPMAERFSDAFGVGDRKTIHMADVAGVMLSVAKELSKKAA